MSRAEAAGSAFDLDSYLRRGREAADQAHAELRLDGIPVRLHPAIRYALGGGGKRLRPILCAAAWRAITRADPAPAVHSIGNAIELIHAYSLVHDDLPFMDDDDTRRGRPTTHRVHGTATAAVAGAAMIVLAFRELRDACAQLGSDPATTRSCLRTLAHAAGEHGMVGGQWLDLAAEGHSLARPRLERIHALKTGALIVAAVTIGGTVAGASATAREALDTYGRAVGLAFQIADDLLDARGDSAEIGKTAGRDAALAKSTYPALLGLDGAERLARAEVERALGALGAAGIDSPELDAIARYAVERRS